MKHILFSALTVISFFKLPLLHARILNEEELARLSESFRKDEFKVVSADMDEDSGELIKMDLLYEGNGICFVEKVSFLSDIDNLIIKMTFPKNSLDHFSSKDIALIDSFRDSYKDHIELRILFGQPLLVDMFIEQSLLIIGQPISEEAKDLFKTFTWNVREKVSEDKSSQVNELIFIAEKKSKHVSSLLDLLSSAINQSLKNQDSCDLVEVSFEAIVGAFLEDFEALKTQEEF